MTTTATRQEILTEAIALYTESISYLESQLSACILIGSPFMIIGDAPGHQPGTTFEVVLGSFTEGLPRYDVNAKPTFRCLDLVQDHLCGVCCYSPESAKRVVAQCVAQIPELKNVRIRHIRDEQKRRLARAKEMLAHLTALSAVN